MDRREVGWEDVDWLRIVPRGGEGGCEHGNEPSGSINGGEFLLSRRTLLHGISYLISDRLAQWYNAGLRAG
jgi:hypothetical protein